MSWFSKPPERPEWCDPEYVCLTAEQAYDECFVGGPDVTSTGIQAGLVFVVTTMFWVAAVWAVNQLKSRLR